MKCASFVDSLFAEQAETGFGLDGAPTVTSALGIAFTPPGATHGLSAAGIIFSRARTSLSTEYLNGLTISHIVQAIQSTYTVRMQYEIARISTANPNQAAELEGAVILSIHKSCSLANAEGTIAATLKVFPTPASPATVTCTVKTDDTTSSVAAGMASKINARGDFKKAGIMATPATSVVGLATPAAPAIPVWPDQ